ARLYAESRLRERWLGANAEITHRLMSGCGRSEVLGLIAERARDITGAALAVVATPMADTGSFTVELALGQEADSLRGLVLPAGEGPIGGAFARRGAVTSDERLSLVPALGPSVAVPVGTADDGVRGVLLLVRGTGRTPFTDKEIEPLQIFAAQAAIAMELAERRREAEEIAVLKDRDRIARDLHDLAIQRLFATGMTLQSAGRFIEHSEASERVLRAVDDLDETIKIIRSTIFGLRAHEGATGSGLRARAVRVVGEAAPALGFAPAFRMEGLIDTDVPKEIADHTIAVLSEALTNIARHAGATGAEAVLATDGHEVVLTVRDDGVGIPADGRRSGLRNMAERARELGGRLEWDCPAGGGTTLVWRVPVTSA
ncbi:MAG TPA: histidine kinase, partial [Streptomyces sp.]